MTCAVCGCPETRWLRVSTVAEHFDCAPKRIRRYILSGRLEAMRMGGEWRIDHESLDQLVREWRLGAQPESGPSTPPPPDP